MSGQDSTSSSALRLDRLALSRQRVTASNLNLRVMSLVFRGDFFALELGKRERERESAHASGMEVLGGKTRRTSLNLQSGCVLTGQDNLSAHEDHPISFTSQLPRMLWVDGTTTDRQSTVIVTPINQDSPF